MVTTFTYKPSLVRIDARTLDGVIVVTAPQTHTQTNRQDRLQYTSSLSLARSVISLLLLLILLRIYHPSVLLHDVLAHTCGNIKLWPRVGGDLTWAYITLIGVKLKLNIILFPGFYVARWPQWLGGGLAISRSRPRSKTAAALSIIATLDKLFTHLSPSPSSINWELPYVGNVQYRS